MSFSPHEEAVPAQVYEEIVDTVVCDSFYQDYITGEDYREMVEREKKGLGL